MKTLDSLIALSTALKNQTKRPEVHKCKGLTVPDDEHCFYQHEYMSLYLFEVKHLKPMIKSHKNKIKLLKYCQQRIELKIKQRESHMKQVFFKKTNYIKIPGRAQGKYCNNLFNYDAQNNIMTYINTQRDKILFPLNFPYRKDELIRVLHLKHSTPGKTVCYQLVDKGEYFLIYATIELNIQYNDFLLETKNGVIGIDINDGFISLSETDKKGNLLYTHDYPLLLKDKTTHQRKWLIEETIKKIMNQCLERGKPLIMEALNFNKKKENFSIYGHQQKYHRMLSEFAYRLMTEKFYQRSYKVHIGIHEVDPTIQVLLESISMPNKKDYLSTNLLLMLLQEEEWAIRKDYP